jgi:hypothetical protein
MKKVLEKTLDLLPYTISIIFLLAIFTFFYKKGIQYDQLLNLLEILIWPIIVLSGLIFFRKVFTYLFLSMEEFNFFGNKGKLRNAQEIIEEKVQKRLEEDQKEKERQISLEKIEDELESARVSRESSEKQAQENFNLAKEVFMKYKELSEESTTLKKELNELRQEKSQREARIHAMRERFRRNREERDAHRYHRTPLENTSDKGQLENDIEI